MQLYISIGNTAWSPFLINMIVVPVTAAGIWHNKKISKITDKSIVFIFIFLTVNFFFLILMAQNAEFTFW